MLIEDKFIYISLPRRGSTSFHYSCILNNFNIKTLDDTWSNNNSKIDFNSISESEIMNYITHGHEPLFALQKKFGTQYPVISVKRDRHEAFYSLYKHLLFDLNRGGFVKVYEHFKNINVDDLFFYKSKDLVSKQTRWEVINDYLLKNKLISGKCKIPVNLTLYSEEYIINIIDIFITPTSYWHNNDSKIIWFDMDKLDVMGQWVSDITQKPFELKKVNSSKHIDSNLIFDHKFIEKYDEIYNHYDVHKSIYSII